MYLFDKLPQEDVAQLNRYLNNYSDGGYIEADRMSYFLRFWNTNKEAFFRMFGEKFILNKEVLFEKPFDEMEEEMDSMTRYGNPLIKRFCQEFKHSASLIFANDFDKNYALQSFVDNTSILVRNESPFDSFVIPSQFTKSGKPLQINNGCKVVKMIGKIADAIGVDVKARICPNGHIDIEDDVCPYCGEKVKEMDGYEAFRQAHSQVLNQKKIKGKLCLSIHPLDFLTMSDNDCGWTSCMSWMEEYGDYRLGTIEMMNSPCVVVAYVEAKDKMWVCGRDWSNKKWRQLYIVTPELILGNKQYPYYSDELQGAAIKWLRDLATASVGWGPYTDEAHQIRNNAWNTINGHESVYFNLWTNYMYNDIYDTKMAYVAPTHFDDTNFNLCISGPAVCCQCGNVIEYDTVDAHNVLCRACDGHWRCDCCGDYHNEYEESYTVGDYVYCDWCYHNELELCECCDERHHSDYMNHIYIQVVNTNNREIIESFNYNYYISLCDNCFDNSDEYEEDFGPVYTVMDMWGRKRKAFDVKNITDRGLCRGDLSSSTIDFLKLMRAAESDEDRLDLIRNISY